MNHDGGAFRRGAARIRSTVRVGGSALVLRAARRLHHQSVIALTYPPSATDVPRFGHGRPMHPGLEELLAGRIAVFDEELRKLQSVADVLDDVPGESGTPLRWAQHWFPALDAVALHGYLLLRRPANYVEIGSGTSTAFAAHARAVGSLQTRIVSVDPEPRAEIESLCDRVVRRPFELSVDVVTDLVGAGDVILFDGSHQVFSNSDTVAFFFEVLPRLPAGVLVGIHDIFLPASYPEEWSNRYYAEQFLLGAFLLGGSRGIAPLLPAYYVSQHEVLAARVQDMTAGPVAKGALPGGLAFWFETTDGKDEIRAPM